MAQYCDNFKFSENNQDHFVMGPTSDDNFQFWQGLRGPYFTPSVDEEGVLNWTNNGQLPNPAPVRIVGKDGRGITLTGQCETTAELPEDPEQGEAWAVGEEEPFECYAWFGEWVDMGLLFPAGQDGVSPAVTITTTATGHKVKITDRDHPSGQEFDVDNGTPGQDGVSPAVTITQTSTGHKVKITDETHPAGQEFDVDNGTPGQDGVSPAVTITQTSTGHKVKITDETHPAGQEFDVDNGTPGAPGQGVPAGGSAGQFLRKGSGTDYDGEWHSADAGDISYDDSLTYESGTVGEELSSQRNTLNQLGTDVDAVETNVGKILPVITGSTNNSGYTINTGDYFEANGTLYQNTSSAAIPIGGTWSGTAPSGTVINKLNNLLNYNLTKVWTPTVYGGTYTGDITSVLGRYVKVGNLVQGYLTFKLLADSDVSHHYLILSGLPYQASLGSCNVYRISNTAKFGTIEITAATNRIVVYFMLNDGSYPTSGQTIVISFTYFTYA